MKEKKYCLVKEYPGSPKLHSIVEVKPDGYIHWNVNSNENNPPWDYFFSLW